MREIERERREWTEEKGEICIKRYFKSDDST